MMPRCARVDETTTRMAGEVLYFMKKKSLEMRLRNFAGSPGRIRTYDIRINSPLRYHCATGEYP